MAGVIGLVVGAGIVGAVWAASSPSKPGVFALHGSLVLAGDHVPSDSDEHGCTGFSGYDDIAAGTSVTVYDAAGKVVAEGSLDGGKYADPTDNTSACVFLFTVPGVPKGTKFYQVEISHRGKITASVAEAQSGKFGATLGS